MRRQHLGMELNDTLDEEGLALVDSDDNETVIYGPVVDCVPVCLDDIANYMIDRIAEADPDVVNQLTTLWKDYAEYRDSGSFGAIFELCSVILSANDLDDYGMFDLKAEISEKCSQAILDTLREILEEAIKDDGDE